MPIDSFMLDPMLKTYKDMYQQCVDDGAEGEHLVGMETTLKRMEELGQEHSDITAFMGALMQEDVQAKFSDHYGKILAGAAKVQSESAAEGGYDDAGMLKQNVNALKGAIIALQDSFDQMVEDAKNYDPHANVDNEVDFAQRYLASQEGGLKLTNAQAAQGKAESHEGIEAEIKEKPAAYDTSVEIEIINDPAALIKPIQDLIDLGEQEGMSFPKFLRLQMERGLDKAMEGNGVIREAKVESIEQAKVSAINPYNIAIAEEELTLFDELAAENKFNCPNPKELSLKTNTIERKYATDIAIWDDVEERWGSVNFGVLEDLNHWAKSYCKDAPFWDPWRMSADPKRAVIKTQDTQPGIIKEKLRLLKKYHGLDFEDIFKHPTFKWSVDHFTNDFSQEYTEYLIEKIYTHCKPFNHLPTEQITEQENIESKDTPDIKTNPEYLKPLINQKEYYDKRFGEGRFESKFGKVKNELNPAAEIWNLGSFKYGK